MRPWMAIILLYFCMILSPLVNAVTPDDITIDGESSDWTQDTIIGTFGQEVVVRVTWNDSFFFMSWEGTDWSSLSEGADLFVYFNTSEGGSQVSRDWNFIHTLPFEADLALSLEDSSYLSLSEYTGSIWEDTTYTPESYVGWSGNTFTEIAIPWDYFGNSTSLEFIIFSQWQNEGHVWSAFPNENPASSNGCLLYTSPSPRDRQKSRMPSSA